MTTLLLFATTSIAATFEDELVPGSICFSNGLSEVFLLDPSCEGAFNPGTTDQKQCSRCAQYLEDLLKGICPMFNWTCDCSEAGLPPGLVSYGCGWHKAIAHPVEGVAVEAF